MLFLSYFLTKQGRKCVRRGVPWPGGQLSGHRGGLPESWRSLHVQQQPNPLGILDALTFALAEEK